MNEFPDTYFHFGGDEINANCWLSDPKVKDFMNKRNMTTIQEILQIFEDRVVNFAKSHGKIPIFWEEIVLNQNITIRDNDAIFQAWVGKESVKALVESGKKVIVGPSDYW